MENFGWVYPCGETVSANPYWPTLQCRHRPTMGLRFSPTFKISVKTELEAWIHSLKDWTLSTSDACEWRLTFGRVRIWAPQLIQLGWAQDGLYERLSLHCSSYSCPKHGRVFNPRLLENNSKVIQKGLIINGQSNREYRIKKKKKPDLITI